MPLRHAAALPLPLVRTAGGYLEALRQMPVIRALAATLMCLMQDSFGPPSALVNPALSLTSRIASGISSIELYSFPLNLKNVSLTFYNHGIFSLTPVSYASMPNPILTYCAGRLWGMSLLRECRRADLKSLSIHKKDVGRTELQ